jgi:hypothetical protein
MSLLLAEKDEGGSRRSRSRFKQMEGRADPEARSLVTRGGRLDRWGLCVDVHPALSEWMQDAAVRKGEE